MNKDDTLYAYLHNRNKGVFYRAETGGTGTYALGEGRYLAYDEGVAKAFATHACMLKGKKDCQINAYTLPQDLKLLDAQSKEFKDIKKGLGYESWDKPGDKLAATIIKEEVQKLGYDGVISDDRFDGLVIYDVKKMVKR